MTSAHLDDETLKALARVSSYSKEARSIASKYLESNSNTDEIDLVTTLAEIREMAKKHNFEIPEDTDDKDELILSLLKFILTLDSLRLERISDIFDQENFDESDDIDPFDVSEAEEDMIAAEIERKFKTYLLAANKFSDVVFLYSNRAMWETMQPQYRQRIASILVDEAIQQKVDNYPEFWNDYLK